MRSLPRRPALLSLQRFPDYATLQLRIRWLVLKQPVTLSQAQLDGFKQALETTNNRPLQHLNGRMVVV